MSILKACKILCLTTAFSLTVSAHMVSAQDADTGILGIGDAVITSFSGVVQPTEEPPKGQEVLDETFIDVNGASARIASLAAPGFRWDARVWPLSDTRNITAQEVGQVFGVTMDDAQFPNVYVTATSAYGLHIVEPDADNDGRPERLKAGKASATWMAGQWGTTDANDPPGSLGGPGSIWKIDGRTGEVSLFANVMFEGVANGGAGLGNIAFDRVHKQLFVSDLATGMIHRFGLDGQELEVWDAGVAGFTAAGEAPVPHDPTGQLDITSKDFGSEDDGTWGLTDKNRRVYALTPHRGRLYYALVGQNQIWSVGLDEKTGSILADARWELDVPTKPNKLPVTDMLFTSQGAMILAQRGNVESTYDYANFTDPGRARVYRFWLETPEDNPATKSRWVEEAEEYAVGFGGDNRATDGGLALNHGYDQDGFINRKVCEASLFTTADNLRNDDALAEQLLPGGPLVIDGLQGMPTGPVKQYPPEKNNTPPWVSYMADVEPANTDQTPKTDDPLQYSDVTTQGWMGDIAILRGCNDAVADSGHNGWPTDNPYWVDNTDPDGPDDVDPPPGCIIGVDCPPPPPHNCARPVGDFVCDPKTGTYTFKGTLTSVPGVNFDKVKGSNVSTGHTLVGGPMLPFSAPSGGFTLTGIGAGQSVSADLCLFNEAEMKSGMPFACCKVTIDKQAPAKACKKQK